MCRFLFRSINSAFPNFFLGGLLRLKPNLRLYLGLITGLVSVCQLSTSPKDTRFNTEAKLSSEIDPAQLIADHQVGIWRYLRALGCESNEAEDLTQETFLAVLRKPFDYYGKAAAASYLRKVAYHRFISARRRISKELLTDEFEHIDENWSRWVEQQQNDGSQTVDFLKECLAQLTDRARWALEMRFRDKLSRVDIANNLEITEHGAKNLMQRAKQKLRDCIEGKMS